MFVPSKEFQPSLILAHKKGAQLEYTLDELVYTSCHNCLKKLQGENTLGYLPEMAAMNKKPLTTITPNVYDFFLLYLKYFENKLFCLSLVRNFNQA